MGGGLVIIEPTTILRDWTRTALNLPEIWAGGWPQTSDADVGIVLEIVSSTLNAPLITWSTQWDCYATTQPAASALASRLATLLARTPHRTLLGSSDAGTVLYGGLIEGSLSIFPVAEEDPDDYRSSLLVDLVTIAVPTPTP